MIENIKEWLDTEPAITEQNEDGSLYVPIWAIESDLNELCKTKDGVYEWSRHNHKWLVHVDHNGEEWLATSILVELNYEGIKRLLSGSSFISPSQYPDSKNFLQTGISEATKAATKVLGNRFGYSLNDRTVIKKTSKERKKAKPDEQILKAYHKAKSDGDSETISRLSNVYDITN